MLVNFNCFGIGLTGGQRVIFDLANSLSKRGYKTNLTVLGLPTQFDWYCGIRDFSLNYVSPPFWERQLKHRILRRQYLHVQQDFLRRHIPDCDLNIATICLSAKPTFESEKGKGFYLVQNFEPWFYSDSVKKTMAEESYGLPLHKLCVSKWLSKKVGGTNIGDGVNLDVFHQTCSFENKRRQLLYLFRSIGRKNDQLALETIKLFCSRLKDVEISIIARSNELLPAFGFKHTIHYDVNDEKLAELYGEAQVSLHTPVFEGFGLQPLESMACGTAVVSTPFYGNEYLEHDVNCLLGGNAEILAAQLENLFVDEERCRRLINKGLKTARAFDFNNVANKVDAIFREQN
jgi:glycosyltransferase involved in cell wall biosynthesis